MFICAKCARKALSKSGKEWPWDRSRGPCELCEESALCLDVPSGVAFAWKSNADLSAVLESSQEERKHRNEHDK